MRIVRVVWNFDRDEILSVGWVVNETETALVIAPMVSRGEPIGARRIAKSDIVEQKELEVS